MLSFYGFWSVVSVLLSSRFGVGRAERRVMVMVGQLSTGLGGRRKRVGSDLSVTPGIRLANIWCRIPRRADMIEFPEGDLHLDPRSAG